MGLLRLLRQPALLLILRCLLTVGLILGLGQPLLGQTPEPAPSASPPPSPPLPPAAIHPLPPTLAQWQDRGNRGNYFDAITPTSVGYLIWSEFPIQVYIQPPDSTELSDRSQVWYEAVNQAVQEWAVYLPLAVTATADTADIKILRVAPTVQLAPATSPNQPLIERLTRVRAAETRYDLFLRRHHVSEQASGQVAPDQVSGQTTKQPSGQAAEQPSEQTSTTLIHRFTIQLTPNQATDYTRATARHELGHALGIWGHSPLPTDTMYFSQVSHPATISPRDINTLKQIYQQPTQLGWPFIESQPAKR
jgi:predicted Zn-dependent protease